MGSSISQKWARHRMPDIMGGWALTERQLERLLSTSSALATKPKSTEGMRWGWTDEV